MCRVDECSGSIRWKFRYVDIDAGAATVPGTCQDCGAEYTRVYGLDDVLLESA